MNNIHRYFTWFFVTVLAYFGTLSPLSAYSYGVSPTGASVVDADLMNKYSTYKTNYFVSDCGPATVTRVRFARFGQTNADQTVSEGMGYGMLMAAYLESDAAGATVVQNLMNFVKSKYASPTYLMDWKVTCAGVVSAGPASDGDMDIALALLQAHKRWPSAGFKTQADTLISRILNSETDACGLKPGAFGGCNGVINLSYHTMAYFTAFACAGYTPFTDVKTASYVEQQKWVTLNYKLPPDWSNQTTGTWSNFNGSTDRYYYDACRTPWRLALDYLWYGNAQAQTLCNRIVSNFKTTDPAPSGMGDGYTASSGTKYSYNHNAAFLGPAACGAMVSSAHQSWLDAAYTNLKNLAATSYYQDSLQVLSLMTLTGVMTDPGCLSGPTATPTATFTVTPTRTPGPNVSISKSSFTNPVHAGETFTYRINFYNSTVYSADSVTVRDTLPSQVTYLSSTPAGSMSGGAYQWTFASLAGGASANVTVACVVGASVPVSTVIVNSADVFGANLSGVRSQPVTVTVADWATTITKSASTASVAVGETFTYTLICGNTSTGADYSQATTGVTLTMHNNNANPTDNAIHTYFRITNNSGASITLSNYRITYWWVNTDHTASEYTTDLDYFTTGTAVTTVRLDTSPSGTGYDQALVVGWSSGIVANGGSIDAQLRTHSTTYAFNESESDDYSFQGATGTYAVNPKVLLEQYKAGVWVYVSGTPPSGGGRTLSAVTVTDRLSTGLTYIGTAGTPAGTYSAGNRTITWGIGSMSPGARLTLTLIAAGLTAGTNTINTGTIDCAEDGAHLSNPVTVAVVGAGPTSTFTPTRTITPTFTTGATNTFTATRTMTPTYTVALTNTFTPSPTNTATFTPTWTLPPGTTVVPPTWTFTWSPTATPPPTLTWTRTFTPTHTNTLPPGITPDTPTYTHTYTHTHTYTYTYTPTFTETFTESPTGIPPTWTPTNPLFGATATNTPVVPGGGITVTEPYPNPVREGGEVFLEIRGPAGKSLPWTIYSTALRKIREGSIPVQDRVVLRWDLRDQKGSPVANGVYYVVFRPEPDASQAMVRKVVVLR